jgi:ssRNA-specific RNase YbeY (16S rRNA maturation enzyme)
MQTNTPAAQQVQSIVNQLNASLLQKDKLTDQLESTNEQVKALRNVLGGIEIGQKLAAEVAAEKDAKKPAEGGIAK